MISLVYFSSAVATFPPLELDQILKVSRRNNATAGVTGLLCHIDGSFLQFLEGDETAVRATFARISADPRHTDLLKVHDMPIESRAFSEWSMGLVRSDEVDRAHASFCRNLRQIEFPPEVAHADALRQFLTTFQRWLR